MRRVILAAILMLLVGVGSGSYFFFKYAAVGTVRLLVTDPPIYEAGSQTYDPSIQHIFVTFTKVDVHSAGAGSDSGWHPLTVGSKTIDLIEVLSTSDVLGRGKLPTGKYDLVRFFADTARVSIQGHATDDIFNISSGGQTGIKVPIVQGGFTVSIGATTALLLTLSFNSHEILANATNIDPVVKAEVVAP